MTEIYEDLLAKRHRKSFCIGNIEQDQFCQNYEAIFLAD